MLKEENKTDECLSCHSQNVLYSLSMASHPNNFSDSLSNVASQSRSQKNSSVFTKQVTMVVGSCCEVGKICVLLYISVQLLVTGPLLPF